MVRTADSALRVTGGKASRKGNVTVRQQSSVNSPPSGGSGDRDRGGSSLNPVCPRETPAWQKPITNFFGLVDKSTNNNQNKDTYNKPGFSQRALVEEGNEVNQISNVETMDEEFQEIRIIKSRSDNKFNIDNKENNSPNETEYINNPGNSANMQTSNDIEMNEVEELSKKKVNARDDDDDDEDVVPKKKIKLDTYMYSHFSDLECS